MMDRVRLWVVFMAFFVLLSVTIAETVQVRDALVQFMEKLAPGNNPGEENWGWNMSSDPCINAWKGISCDKSVQFVQKIVLDKLNFTGVLDAASVCSAKNLAVLSLNNNNVSGILQDEISNCTRLTHLYLHGNNLSGNLPGSLSRLSNLKRLDVSDNGFYGGIPDISRVSGLLTFLAQNNQFDGVIPKFEFLNLEEFNVSNNNLSGSIPDVEGHFNASSFLGNPELCGKPLPNNCPPPQPPAEEKGWSSKMYLMYLGYALIALILLSLVALKVIWRNKHKDKKEIVNRGLQTDATKDKISSRTSSELKRGNISEYSITSVESGMGSSSLVVLSNPVVYGLKFKDLLRSPAELIWRGRHGSLYKVTLDSGVTLAVKRIRDWDISRDDFKKRVHRIDQVKHSNVMPVVAYYCSSQEQLVVYEFQHNGSLFRLLHGSQNGQLFDWGSRLSVAARIAKALAFMHEELQRDGIAHGNLKSSNILLNNGMEPCISEYGLSVVNNQDSSVLAPDDSFQDNTLPVNNASNVFKADVYGFGIILLELLTGKLVQNNGYELGQWVNSAIREEWTVEFFDKTLVLEGASEEMVNLLQVALKCTSSAPEERPSIREVAVIIDSIKEYEEKSFSSEA
ncbi:unnamed protein product [Fraxinus pennsylvanica]|uniref:Protein kinase domain-containing protein n=1 Tax=Fraxinus pennsylvanica TaxID=56036 RepID=A0AAD2DHF6_9LAMI|nr:unnamed protein product [Fraxinus pennsylvanica]